MHKGWSDKISTLATTSTLNYSIVPFVGELRSAAKPLLLRFEGLLVALSSQERAEFCPKISPRA